MIARLLGRLLAGPRAQLAALLADDSIDATTGCCCAIDHTDVDDVDDLDAHAETAFAPVTPPEPTPLVELCRESYRRNNTRLEQS